MFDYSIGHYRKRPPSKRILASWVVSCLVHVCAVLILIRYPQLLRGGMNLWYRPPTLDTTVPPAKEWRTVAVLGNSMQMPSDEMLRKLLYGEDESASKARETAPIRVNLRAGTADKPIPEPQPAPPPNPPAAAPPVSAAAGTGAGGADAAHPETVPETKKPLAPPAPTIQAPAQIPKGLPDAAPPGTVVLQPTPVTPPPTRPAAKTSENQQNTTRVQGMTLFDTKGFNLDDWAKLIEEKVKGYWEIPSDLRDSRGSTTVLFYISKDGRPLNAKIEVSSGNARLDLAALGAVVAANPFPPLPQGFPSNRVGARFVFAYNERK